MIKILSKELKQIIKKLQYIGVDSTMNAFTFFFNGEEFYYKYVERIVLAYNIEEEKSTKVNYINGNEIEIIYTGNEELKLADEEMVTLKLCNYFIDEKELFGN